MAENIIGNYVAPNTTQAAAAWNPDVTALGAQDVLPEALILKATTVVNTSFEGERGTVLVPWIDDDAANWTPEGHQITDSAAAFNQVAIPVRKIAKLMPMSNELWSGGQYSELISSHVLEAMTKTANTAFLANVADQPGDLQGIANHPEILKSADSITTSLDPLADALGQVEANGGTPQVILINPLAWSALRKLKTAEAANTALLGAGTQDQEKFLYGIPVITTPAAPRGSLVIIDTGAIASVCGNVQVEQSEHALFAHDSVAIRAVWHMGWAVQRPDRLALVTVAK